MYNIAHPFIYIADAYGCFSTERWYAISKPNAKYEVKIISIEL